MTDHSIKGKVALIAGGAKNLGGLLARDLAQQGARAVVIHYNSAASQADAESTAAAVRAAGAEALTLQADLTTAGAMEKLFADAVAAFGRPDIAINNVHHVGMPCLQQRFDLPQCILAALARTEPVARGQEHLLEDRLDHPLDCRLGKFAPDTPCR